MSDTVYTNLVDADLAERIKQLMLFSRYRVEGRFAGDNKSTLKGFSSDFLQHRQYFPGDNLKYLDWRVYGRTSRFVIREFEETTNLDLYLIIDKSRSMGACGGRPGKDEHAVKTAAILIYMMMMQKDSFGMTLFSDSAHTHLKPGTSRRHLQRLYEALLTHQPDGETDWETSFSQARARCRRRGLVIVLSDFMDDPERIAKAMTGFRSANHDVIAMHIVDPFETDLQQTGMTRYVDVESGDALTADPLLMRSAYQEEFKRHIEHLRREFSARGIAHVLVRADDEYEEAIGSYLQHRCALLS